MNAILNNSWDINDQSPIDPVAYTYSFYRKFHCDYDASYMSPEKEYFLLCYFFFKQLTVPFLE